MNRTILFVLTILVTSFLPTTFPFAKPKLSGNWNSSASFHKVKTPWHRLFSVRLSNERCTLVIKIFMQASAPRGPGGDIPYTMLFRLKIAQGLRDFSGTKEKTRQIVARTLNTKNGGRVMTLRVKTKPYGCWSKHYHRPIKLEVRACKGKKCKLPFFY